jgi:hypothetical protein
MTSKMREDSSTDAWSESWFDEQPAPTITTRYLLGDLLVGKGLITNAQLETALAIQQREGGRLGEILVAEGALTLTELMAALAEQHGLEAEIPTSLRDRLGPRNRQSPAA